MNSIAIAEAKQVGELLYNDINITKCGYRKGKQNPSRKSSNIILEWHITHA